MAKYFLALFSGTKGEQMDGKTFANIVQAELLNQGKSKGWFYEEIGLTPAAMWGWKNGATPKPETIKDAERVLGISFDHYEKSDKYDPESVELLDAVQNRHDIRLLIRSVLDLPPSSVYGYLSQIEKEKEKNH